MQTGENKEYGCNSTSAAEATMLLQAVKKKGKPPEKRTRFLEIIKSDYE